MKKKQPKWKPIKMGERLPCWSFIRKMDGTVLPLTTIGGAFSGQEAYYLPVKDVIEIIKNFPKEIVMDYEKEYKLLIARLKALADVQPAVTKAAIESQFPELKESEGERISKALIKLVKKAGEGYENVIDGVSIEDAISWLEKQGKSSYQIHYWTEEEIEPIISDYLRGAEHYGGMIARLRCLKPKFLDKQGEHTDILDDAVLDSNKDGLIADTIRCKKESQDDIKIGDLITNGILVGKIDEIHKWGYHAYFGDHYADVPDMENWHKWTIQDAKDGDVLVNDSGNIFIYKNYLNNIVLRDYCHLATPGYIVTEKDNEGGYTHITTVYPATKEQRDLLFQKMHEAGYEWDAEKKELKKIEQKSADTYCQEHCKGYQETGRCFADGGCQAKRDNDKKLQQKTKETMPDNHAWSKEDGDIIDWLIGYLEYQIMNATITEEKGNCLDAVSMLKAIKGRYAWKPSKEQMRELSIVATGKGWFSKEILSKLLEDLKKLKG